MGASASKPAEVKPKKICCACPITKQARDACLPENDEEKCKYLIDAHLRCLRDVGFDVCGSRRARRRRRAETTAARASARAHKGRSFLVCVDATRSERARERRVIVFIIF
jgi:cytochrome c oxidase assembly protein subunit 17